MIEVPDNFFETKFFQHVGFAKRQSNGNMIGCCPFCLEDSSWGKKKRFYYYQDKKFCKCFNCGVHCDPINFLKRLEGLPFGDLIRLIRDNGGDFQNDNWQFNQVPEEPKDVELPNDSIDLFDKRQTEFFRDDYFVQLALKTIKKRRLDTASNRGELYLSREDFTHKNRIIIPFKNEQDELTFYQSRSQNKKQEDFGKYLSSANGKKTFYGFDKLDFSQGSIFVIEGPLDCFFVPNSIGGGGILLNNAQKAILDDLEALHDVVYCLDNDFSNADVAKLYTKYIKQKKKVFMWEGDFANYKDFNDYCIGEKKDIIKPEEILKYTYSGSDASKAFVDKIKLIR